VQADLGYQGASQFRLSLNSDLITAYAADCSECAQAPYLATEYFSMTNFDTTAGYIEYTDGY